MRLSSLTSSSRRTAASQRQRSAAAAAVVRDRTTPCRVRYAVLTDRLAAGEAAERSVEICGGSGGRQRQVYVSSGNIVEISVDVRRDSPDHFVLLYEGPTSFSPL